MEEEPKISKASASLVIGLFEVLYLLGVLLCLFTLNQMWGLKPLLSLMLSRIPIVGLLGGQIPMWILLTAVALFALAGIVRMERLVWVWLRGETIADAASRLRSGLYLAMALLFVCVFILSTPESFSGPFRLRHPVAAWVAASFAFGIWMTLPALKPYFSNQARRRLDLICLNVGLTLILAEVVLRVLSVVWASPLLITESTSSQIRRESERFPPGAERFSFPVNSAGHYDSEFLPREERSLPLVITIGDSFSYGVVPHHYHYTTVAERAFPGAEIYNIGFPGTNPSDYLYHLVEEALPLDPDLIVISLFVGNDIIADAPPASPIRWYDAERYLVGIVWHRVRILRRMQSSDWTQDPPDSIGEDLVSRYPWLSDPSLERPSLGEEAFLAMEINNAGVGAAGHPGLYEHFFIALRKIEDAAGDVPLVFLIIPDEYQVNDELWQVVVENNELPLQRDLPQSKIREWAQAGDRDIVDLLPLFLAEKPLPDGQRHLYHLRDGHFNARGNAVAGRALASMIEAKLTGGKTPDVVMASSAEKSAEPGNTESKHSELADAALQQTEPQGVEPQSGEPQAESPADKANKVLQQFGDVVSGLGLNGTEVFDDSLLGRPKDEIMSAIVIVLNGDITAEQQTMVREAAQVLAFFQPGVGEAGVAIDTVKSDQQTWRTAVAAEMQEIHRKIASQTAGQR